MSTSAEMFLRHVANVIAERGAHYGIAGNSMTAIATRWSTTLGHPVGRRHRWSSASST